MGRDNRTAIPSQDKVAAVPTQRDGRDGKLEGAQPARLTRFYTEAVGKTSQTSHAPIKVNALKAHALSTPHKLKNAFIAKLKAFLTTSTLPTGAVDKFTSIVPIPQGRVLLGIPTFSLGKTPSEGREVCAKIITKLPTKASHQSLCSSLPQK